MGTPLLNHYGGLSFLGCGNPPPVPRNGRVRLHPPRPRPGPRPENRPGCLHKYQGQELHMVCILKGAYQFYNDLLDEIKTLNQFHSHESETVHLSLHFVRVKSYEGTESTGNVRISGIDLQDLA